MGPRRALHRRAGARRAGGPRERVPGGHIHRDLPRRVARQRGHAEAVPSVLVPRRRPEPRVGRNPWVDPRGRRAGLLARARLRRGAGRPEPHRVLRDRRRRGRDRSPRRVLALEQVPRSGARRRGPTGPPPERLQDREPDRPRADARARAARPPRGIRPCADLRGRRRAGGHAPADGRGSRSGRHRDRTHPGRGAHRREREPAALADDRPSHTEGLDRPEGRGWAAGRGHLAIAPGPDRRRKNERRAPCAARAMDALVPAGGAVRRERDAGRRACGPPADRRTADERQPALERRRPVEGPGPARLP